VVEEKKDSLKSSKNKGRKGQSLIQYLAGDNVFFGRKDSLGRKPMVLKIYSPLMNLSYNGVEGFTVQQDVFFKRFLRQSRSRFRDDRPYIQMGTVWRYSKGRKKLLGTGTIQYGNPKFVVQVSHLLPQMQAAVHSLVAAVLPADDLALVNHIHAFYVQYGQHVLQGPQQQGTAGALPLAAQLRQPASGKRSP
jgi:hypothetical protein